MSCNSSTSKRRMNLGCSCPSPCSVRLLVCYRAVACVLMLGTAHYTVLHWSNIGPKQLSDRLAVSLTYRRMSRSSVTCTIRAIDVLNTFRWMERLPQEVKDAGGPAADCALFWPDAATGAAAASSSPPATHLLARLRASAPISTLRLALQVLSRSPLLNSSPDPLLHA